MAGLVPLTITAHLEQGLAFDVQHGLAFESILASTIRGMLAGGLPGSVLDGGLKVPEVTTYELPLGVCDKESKTWHWLSTSGVLLDATGVRILPPIDAHRLLQTIDEPRSEQVALSLPMHLDASRGRFRNRITPVLTIPASKISWHAVGDKNEIELLLHQVHAIGARRGSGEGRVVRWQLEEQESLAEESWWAFAHKHPTGGLGRLMPRSCAEALTKNNLIESIAGLRPPMFHSGNQHLLVLPE